MTARVYALTETTDGESLLLGISTSRRAAEVALDMIVDSLADDLLPPRSFYLAEHPLDEFNDHGAPEYRVVFDGTAHDRVRQREIDLEDQEREYRACQAAGLSWPSEMP